MNFHSRTLASVGVIVFILDLVAVTVSAQRAAESTSSTGTPLKVEVVLSRFQGEKRISRLPHTLSVHADAPLPSGLAQLRMQVQVPVSGSGSETIVYKEIGTKIDCVATSIGGGRFKLVLSIEDTSVYSADQIKQLTAQSVGQPMFRTLRSSNLLLVSDGQATQFTAATDRVTGEVVSVEVTATRSK